MPKFGQHETAQRLFLSGVGALYALAADDKKVIKVLQPAPGIWSEDQLREEIDSFLLRAKTQRRLAKASQFWAPVYEVSAIREGTEGSSGGGDAASSSGEYRACGAYAVLDRFERSLQSLLDGRVNLHNADLRNIMTGIIQGLLDIQKTGRPHGNLKPSNVLLANSADLAAARVCLADPAADGALTAKTTEKDLTDLAKILYEIVNLRPYGGGTIGRTKDWDELGPNGEDWRKLCNTLLDPHAPAAERDLEKILPVIATWTLKPIKSKKPMILAASILFVLLLGGGITWYMLLPPKLDFNQPAWEKLCLNYHAWFGDFIDHFADDSTRQKFASAPYPPEVNKFITDAGKELDLYQPKTIARQPSSADELAVHPTDYAKKGYGPYYTKKGDALIDSVIGALTPEHWPLLKTLDDTATLYTQRGWNKPAAGIRALIASARPPEIPDKPLDIEERPKLVHPVDLFSSIDKTILASKSVTDINSRWARIQDLLKRVPSTDVPLLQALPKFAEDLPRSEVDPAKPATLEDVTSLAASFTQVEQLINQLVTELTPQPGREIVYTELAKDPAAQLPANGAVTIEQYKGLPIIARGYLKMNDDPRALVNANWKSKSALIQSDMTDYLAKAAAKIPDAKSHLDDLTRRYAAFEAQLTAAAQTPAIEKNRPIIAKAAGDAAASLDKLALDSATWSAPFKTDPVQYVKQKRDYLLTSPLAKATPIVYDQWKAAHTRFLNKVEATREKLRTDYTYKLGVDDTFAAIQDAYTHVEESIPAKVPGLSDITGNDWRHTIAAYIATAKREDALRDIMAKIPFTSDAPRETDPAFVSFRRERLATFDKTRTDAIALITDYSAINDNLDHLYIQPNEPAPGAKTWRDLYAAWQSSKNPLLSDSIIAAALKPIADRVIALMGLDSTSDYKPLLAQTSSPAPEIALTAWRKLGTAPISEDLSVLDDEDKAEAALTAQLNALATAKTITSAQLTGFTREIAVQRPIRWHRWADVLSSPAAIQTALDHLASFNVSLNPQTDANLIYNQTFYDLRKEFDKNPKEADLKIIAQKFIDDVSKLPPTVGQDKGIQDLLARMTKSLSQSQDDSSAAGAGPKLAGWEQDIPADRPDLRLYYFPNKATPRYILTFVRMQVSEAGSLKTIFLCTTETSVGIFADTINASGKFADLDNTGKTSAQAHWFKVPARQADDIWADLGPRAWKIADKKFALNSAWLSETAAQMVNQSYYPENLKPELPTPDYPMQLLSPWAAMYTARLLGCRLPTSDEWKAAYDRFEAPAGGAAGAALPKDVWNLRGDAPANAGHLSWRSEQDYASKMADKGMKFPDQGAFLSADLLFAGITAQDAKPWKADALAKLAPTRITPSPDSYKGSTLWFRKVGTQPNTPAPTTGAMHDLVGNVAEYVFDGPNAIAVVKDTQPTVSAIDAAITAGKKNLYVIGGSSLSPDIAFNQKQELDPGFAQTATGYCDVGFRLAYTAPIDSITDVLAAAFKEPRYFPGAKAH